MAQTFSQRRGLPRSAIKEPIYKDSEDDTSSPGQEHSSKCNTNQKPGLETVTIVGAGPSGLLLALLLTSLAPQPKITILDAATQLDASPRATHYGPAAVRVLRRAGILDTVRKRGFVPRTLCWRKLNGERLAGFDRGLLVDGLGDELTIMPVGELGGVLVDALREKGVEVSWGQKVIELGGQEDGAEKAWVEVENVDNGDKTKVESDVVVGCDGGNSSVRRLLYGSGTFPGFTWDRQVVATNTYYDFSPYDWEETNFVIDPEHWYMAAKITSDGLWRISYGEQSGLTTEELMKRQPTKFQQMLPGNPSPDKYKVASISPYKVHQRCVEKMAIGRIALAADAAHLCNPFGGLGLTGGIVDVNGLFDCLRGIHAGVADISILKTYSDIRIEKWQTVVNPVSSSNIKRLFEANPDTVMQTDDFLQMVKKAETDVETSKKMQQFSYALEYDFTKHYQKPIDDSKG